MQVMLNQDSDVLKAYPWLANKVWWIAQWDSCMNNVTLEDPELPTVHWNDKLHINRAAIAATKSDSGVIEMCIDLNLTPASGIYDYRTIAIPKDQYDTMPGATLAGSMCANTSTLGMTSGPGVYQGIVITSSGVNSWNSDRINSLFENKEDLGGQVHYIRELEFKSLISTSKAAQTVIRRVCVDPDAPYWQTFKGVAQELDGLPLRFYRGVTENIDCVEYEDVECSVLASEISMKCRDVFDAEYVQSLHGLIIPDEFLK